MTIAARHILTPGFPGKRTSPAHGLSGIGRWGFEMKGEMIADDISGKDRSGTRKMGVNRLAFRTPLFVSFPRETVRPEQEAALRAALAAASRKLPLGEPLDWQEQLTPSRWCLEGRERDSSW